MPVARLVVVSLVLAAAALGADACGSSDTKVLFPSGCTNPIYKPRQMFTRLVMTYTGARPPAGGSSIQEDFPCHGP